MLRPGLPTDTTASEEYTQTKKGDVPVLIAFAAAIRM